MPSRTRYAIYAAGAAIAVFAIFVTLAQVNAIAVPYFTPITLQVDGLKTGYAAGENATFAVTANGYGSNCLSLQVVTTHDDSGQRVSFYKKAEDCRYIPIIHGQYNLTRAFDYGSQVMGKAGKYTVDITFSDLIDNRQARLSKTFEVKS